MNPSPSDSRAVTIFLQVPGPGSSFPLSTLSSAHSRGSATWDRPWTGGVPHSSCKLSQTRTLSVYKSFPFPVRCQVRNIIAC